MYFHVSYLKITVLHSLFEILFGIITNIAYKIRTQLDDRHLMSEKSKYQTVETNDMIQYLVVHHAYGLSRSSIILSVVKLRVHSIKWIYSYRYRGRPEFLGGNFRSCRLCIRCPVPLINSSLKLLIKTSDLVYLIVSLQLYNN